MNDCKKPKDQARIEANKKKWQAERAAARNSNRNGSGGKSGERRKWGTESGGTRFSWFKDCLMHFAARS